MVGVSTLMAGISSTSLGVDGDAHYNRTVVRLFPGQPSTRAAAARASAALDVRSTASAASRHCCSVTDDSLAPTARTAAAAADKELTPSPASTQASSGSAAASPHTPTGLPASTPALAAR